MRQLMGGAFVAAALACAMTACGGSSKTAAPANTTPSAPAAAAPAPANPQPAAPAANAPAAAPAAQPAGGGAPGATSESVPAGNAPGGGRGGRGGPGAAAAAQATCHHGEADADRLRDCAVARSARRAEGGTLGRRRGRMEHAGPLVDPAVGEVARREQRRETDPLGRPRLEDPHALRSRVLRQVRDRGELQRLRNLGHLESRKAGDCADLHLSGVAERRLYLQEHPRHVIGSHQQPQRLQLRRCAGSREQRPGARRAPLRHQQPGGAEARRERADVPRLAHAHRRDAAWRQRQLLHLHLGHQPRAFRGRVARLHGLGRRRQRRSDRAVPPRGDQGSAQRAADGGDRQLAAHLQRAAAGSGESGPRRG